MFLKFPYLINLINLFKHLQHSHGCSWLYQKTYDATCHLQSRTCVRFLKGKADSSRGARLHCSITNCNKLNESQ